MGLSNLVAYLDPGSGSIILQALVGGVAGLVLTARLWWRGLTTKLGLGRARSESDEA